jgi:hypothetical protein
MNICNTYYNVCTPNDFIYHYGLRPSKAAFPSDFHLIPKRYIDQSAGTMPNEAEVTSSNPPTLLVWTCKKKKKKIVTSIFIDLL